MKISNELYDKLAWIGRIFLPALSVLYATLGKIWNLPYTEQIPLSITAVDLFLNALLGISSNNYFSDKEIIETNVNNISVDNNG